MDEVWKVNSDPRLSDVTADKMQDSFCKAVQRQAAEMQRPGLIVAAQICTKVGNATMHREKLSQE